MVVGVWLLVCSCWCVVVGVWLLVYGCWCAAVGDDGDNGGEYGDDGGGDMFSWAVVWNGFSGQRRIGRMVGWSWRGW